MPVKYTVSENRKPLHYSVRNPEGLDEVNRSLGRKCYDASRSHPVKDASLTGCTDKTNRYKLIIFYSVTGLLKTSIHFIENEYSFL